MESGNYQTQSDDKTSAQFKTVKAILSGPPKNDTLLNTEEQLQTHLENKDTKFCEEEKVSLKRKRGDQCNLKFQCPVCKNMHRTQTIAWKCEKQHEG